MIGSASENGRERPSGGKGRDMQSVSETGAGQRAGLTAALVSYAIWGMMPLYWSRTAGALPLEVLSHRIVWAVACIALALLASGRIGEVRGALAVMRRDPRQSALIFSAAVFASLNWLVNILGSHLERVVELGIGMFLTPLMTVLFGAIFYRERMSLLRCAAVGLAACGLAVMVASLGRLPLIAIGVSSTWAAYSAVKKSIRVDAMLSTGIEHALMLPFAAAFLIWLTAAGEGHFLSGGTPGLWVLLFGTGIVTSVPMVAYSFAAQRLPLNVLGVIQYLNPLLTISVGCLIMGEAIGVCEAIALGFIILGVTLFALAPRFERRR